MIPSGRALRGVLEAWDEPIPLGVDVAADGGDEFVIAKRTNWHGEIVHFSTGPANEDARHVPLELTGEGRAALTDSKVAIERHENWVKQRLTAADQRAIATLMGKIYRSAD